MLPQSPARWYPAPVTANPVRDTHYRGGRPPEDIRAPIGAALVDITYTGPDEQFTASLSQDVIDELRGCISKFNSRARVILVGLLNGFSLKQATLRAGRTSDCAERWAKVDPEFREAMELCKQYGTAFVYESELERRALAGSDDRGSMRALELVVKARDASYRDKSQVEVAHVIAAQNAEAQLTSGWRDVTPIEGP